MTHQVQNYVFEKKRQLRNDLRNIFLNNSSIFDYLVRIQTTIDSLSSIGEHVSESDHVDIILDGLPNEFESLITFVSGKFESMSIDEVATLSCDSHCLHEKSCLVCCFN